MTSPFLLLLLRRIDSYWKPFFYMVLSLSICFFCIHIFAIFQHNIAQSYVKHSRLAPLIIAPPGAVSDRLAEGLLFLKQPQSTLSFTDLPNHSYIKEASPIYLGERYKGYTVIATSPAFFNILKKSSPLLASGAMPQKAHHVLLGANVQNALSLTDTSPIYFSHGTHIHKEDSFYMSGVLNATDTVLDNIIFITKQAFIDLHPHAVTRPHFFWVSPTKPVFQYSLIRHFNSQKGLYAISPKLEKKQFVSLLKQSRYLIQFSLLCLIVVVGIQFLMSIQFHSRRYFNEFKVLFHSGASLMFLFGQLCVELCALFILSIMVAFMLTGMVLSTYSNSFSMLLQFPVTEFSLNPMFYTWVVCGSLCFSLILAFLLVYSLKRKISFQLI